MIGKEVLYVKYCVYLNIKIMLSIPNFEKTIFSRY